MHLFIFVDIPSAPQLGFFTLPVLEGHVDFPQVYSPSPGSIITHSYSQSLGQQRGVWRGQAARTLLPGAKIRENNGPEVPARGTRGGAVVWSGPWLTENICHPPVPALAFICSASGSSRDLWSLWGGLCRCFLPFTFMAAFILLHPLSGGFSLCFCVSTNPKKVWFTQTLFIVLHRWLRARTLLHLYCTLLNEEQLSVNLKDKKI